ncbi:hypothetical protein D3C87_1892770 [compost metagenome]
MNCPIRRFEFQLQERGLLTREQQQDAEARLEAEWAEAVAFAKSSPFPEESTMREHVYAQGER